MEILEYISSKESKAGDTTAHKLETEARKNLAQWGIPAAKHEEWKYTRISNMFSKDFSFDSSTFTQQDLDSLRLPGHADANELVFINGIFSPALSTIRTEEINVYTLEQASQHSDYASIIEEHLGHSRNYHKDGINALNTTIAGDGIFIQVQKNRVQLHPFYIYTISDARMGNSFAQPRSLIHVSENAHAQFVETNITLGSNESFTNQVVEIIVEKDAVVEYYKIQNDQSQAHLVSTTHIRQVGTSIVHAITVSLNGGMVRNNLNVIMEAPHSTAHMYGLYLLHGSTHVDNHTIVDNREPHCLSNELYKGILNDESMGVFNGKIFVQQKAQKTNAYQSNKNILLSPTAVINTKPQLEIFADDVKCSHGSTVGTVDEDALFYLQARGIPKEKAQSLLLHGFALDILEKIKPSPIRLYVDSCIHQQLDIA